MWLHCHMWVRPLQPARKKMAELAYQNLVDALEGRVPRYVVNPKF